MIGVDFASLTEFDRRLLDVAQRRVPLVGRPYQALAFQLGSAEDVVLNRLQTLRGGDQPIVREISGVFEIAMLGYRSTLVACRVAGENLDAAGAAVARHPGVSHCYARSNELNLWFTLSLGPDSRLGLAGTVEHLGRQIGADAVYELPTLQRFKIGVHIGPDGRMDSFGSPPLAQSPLSLDRTGQAAVRALQMDLPTEPEPFVALAVAAGLSVDALLAAGSEFGDRGVLRRYGAMLHHRRAGLEANAMVAWRVDPEGATAAGTIAAAQAAVSHCYLRPPAPQWPYTLYTMIHGRTRAECEAVVGGIATEAGLTEYVVLWTAREFKKSRVVLFGDEVAAWEATCAG